MTQTKTVDICFHIPLFLYLMIINSSTIPLSKKKMVFGIPLPVILILCFFFLHNHSFTYATNFPAPYSCFPVDTNPVHYRCFDNNNLAVHDCAFSLPHTPSFSPPKPWKWVLLFGRVNTIATLLILIITLLNVIVYKLRQLQEFNSGEKLTVLSSSSLTPSEETLCRRFSLSEILSATHNFDESLVIGKGGFGKVYKGVVDSGASTVAVKRLSSMSKQGASEFWTEISMLSKYRHSHLVSLLGYCDNYSEMILVYENMVNGSLADHLHKKIAKNGDSNNSSLSWVRRLKICVGSARGLDYLHTGTGILHRVIHRDVKSTNILLDENWEAKISDFGMSKIGPANQSCTHISTQVKGTFGYVDPEYFLTRRLTRKSDVYSFGVVLLEVLCGRPAVDSKLQEDQRGLARWAQHCIKEGKVDQIVDPAIKGQIQSNCLSAFVQVAEQCLDILPKNRPTMAEVVAWLEFALSLQQKGDLCLFEDEGFLSTSTVSESQENVSSSTNQETVSEDDEVGNGNFVAATIKPNIKGGVSGTESPLKPISRSLTNPVKRMTVRKQVQLLFRTTLQVSSEKIKGMGNCIQKTKNDHSSTIDSSSEACNYPKPSSDRNNENDVVQLVPPSRHLVTTGPGKGTRAKKAQEGSKNSGRSSTSTNKNRAGNVCSLRESGEILASQNLKIFTYAELKIATSDFRPNRFLGDGGFGKVYKGWVNEKTFAPTKPSVGMPIAVKIFNPDGFQGFKEWKAEVGLLGKYCHPNIVKLLGYCSEHNQTLLVYEYMAKGSLENNVFRKNVDPLSWAIRLKVATGAARGLAFLHTTENQVIYRDFKSSNILLDDDLNPKLSDFGLAILGPREDYTHVSTQVVGTYGYAAPEYVATGHLYVKSDVYGFGVVLLELLTGLRVLDVNRPAGNHNLVDYARPLLGDKIKLLSLVDPRLKSNYPQKGAFGLATLVQRCLEISPQARPTMTKVVETLEQILLIQ